MRVSVSGRSTRITHGGRRVGVAVPNNPQTNPLAPRNPHFDAKAKRVIYLFMVGGPSQLELFDFKPKLQEMDGEVIPESYVEGKNFAFLKKDAQLLGTKRKFQKWGESGQEMSELLPHLGDLADKIAIIRSMKTDVFNHGPAKLFMNTGFQRFGRPSMGAWVTYGIGSESNNLPGFVVMHSGPRGIPAAALHCGVVVFCQRPIRGFLF